MDGVILVAIIVPGMIALFNFMLHIAEEGGSKGIEKRPYFGKYSGKIHTAKKDRENYIV